MSLKIINVSTVLLIQSTAPLMCCCESEQKEKNKTLIAKKNIFSNLKASFSERLPNLSNVYRQVYAVNTMFVKTTFIPKWHIYSRWITNLWVTLHTWHCRNSHRQTILLPCLWSSLFGKPKEIQYTEWYHHQLSLKQGNESLPVLWK